MSKALIAENHKLFGRVEKMTKIPAGAPKGLAELRFWQISGARVAASWGACDERANLVARPGRKGNSIETFITIFKI